MPKVLKERLISVLNRDYKNKNVDYYFEITVYNHGGLGPNSHWFTVKFGEDKKDRYIERKYVGKIKWQWLSRLLDAAEKKEEIMTESSSAEKTLMYLLKEDTNPYPVLELLGV